MIGHVFFCYLEFECTLYAMLGSQYYLAAVIPTDV